MSRSNRHDPSGIVARALRNVSSPNVRPSCINIGSLARLKGLFAWVDDARERQDFAPADTDHSDRACRRFRYATAHKIEGRRPQRSIICAILSPGFAAKL